jgi:caa(3)-type oxidase subunit IV
MSGHSIEDIKKSIKKYWMVFAALTVGTIITVAVAEIHLGIILGITVALIVAVTKGTLVAGYFMHLFEERKMIYDILLLTAVFVVVMVGLVMWTAGDQQGAQHGIFQVPARRAHPHANVENQPVKSPAPPEAPAKE